MKELHEQWNQLTARQKAPYEHLASSDAERYRREVHCYKIKSEQLKRLCQQKHSSSANSAPSVRWMKESYAEKFSKISCIIAWY